MADATAPDCPLALFYRALRATKALRNVKLLPGARGKAIQGSPNRIVLWPADGEFDSPEDYTVSIFDVKQSIIVEIWGKGSSTGAGDEAVLADWNAAYSLLTLFMQAMCEQGEAPGSPNAPGAFWQATIGPSWDTSDDTGQQGTSVKMLFTARCAIPAASDDTGHVGDNWPQGTATAVTITGAP